MDKSKGRKIDPPLHRSSGFDFKSRSRLRMTSLLMGRETRVYLFTRIKSMLVQYGIKGEFHHSTTDENDSTMKIPVAYPFLQAV